MNKTNTEWMNKIPELEEFFSSLHNDKTLYEFGEEWLIVQKESE